MINLILEKKNGKRKINETFLYFINNQEGPANLKHNYIASLFFIGK